MSTLKHPVGPQSSKVYWRRRLFVGLGLLAVIVAIILIVVRPGASAGEPTSPPASAAAPPAESTTIPTEETSAEGKACKPDAVQVTAITDAISYAPGELPQLSLSVTNTGAKDCVLNVGSSAQVFTITSGSEVYWLSTDCQTDAVDAEVTLAAGESLASAAPIAWDRTRSSVDTCDSAGEPVPAGDISYHLTVTVDGVESESKQFQLN